MGISSILDIAKTALLTSQKALQTTSHNIANANTPGYTRQKVVLSAGEPLLSGGQFVGTGVKVEGVERAYDRFLGLQILDSAEKKGRFTALEEALRRLEGIFNDLQGTGIGEALNEFFKALSDVSNDPSSYSARAVLLGKARVLVDRIKDLNRRLEKEMDNIDQEVKGEVGEINDLAKRIAALNEKIQRLEAGGEKANDLRDKRDLLIQELAGKIDLTHLEDESGSVSILVAGGHSLVAGSSYSTMGVARDADNHNRYGVTIGGRDITEWIGSGSLKGLIEARDTHFQGVKDKLDLFAATLVQRFNYIHRQGYGLDGSTGNNLFSDLSVTATALTTNTGGASVTSTSILTYDPSTLTLDDYEIRFTSSSTFNIVNVTDGTIVSTGNTYTSGSNIDFDGIRVVITDGTSGPAAGDVFRISVKEDAAEDISLSLTDTNKFAAAKSSSTLPGDNRNVLDMLDLQGTLVLSGGSATFNDFYAGMVSDIGTSYREASTNLEAQEAIMEDLESQRQAASGVSLDEEASNLVKYQYAYQAAAKVLATAETLFETLISMR